MPLAAAPDPEAIPLHVVAPEGLAGWLEGQDAATCQVVEAPPGDGRRLVHESDEPPPRVPDLRSVRAIDDEDGEIRLTYRQLSALIEDAIRSLK